MELGSLASLFLMETRRSSNNFADRGPDWIHAQQSIACAVFHSGFCCTSRWNLMSPIFSGASGGSRASCGSPCKGHLGYEHQWYELPAGSTSQQFAATRKEFRLQPTALRNQGSHPKCESPGSRPTLSQHEVEGNVGHLEFQMPCVRRSNFP